MKRYFLCIAVVFSMFILFAGTFSPVRAASIEPFTIASLEKLLGESKGKVVMINFFASWCPPCLKEVPMLINIRKTFGEDKLIVIGVSLDHDNKALQAYMANTPFNYPVKLAAPELAQAAGVSGIPHMLIFDRKGDLVVSHMGLVGEDELRKFLQSEME